jgi:co-chaperonin GroES (HSP10)
MNEYPITPCGLAVLLEMDPLEEKSEAGIILPGGDKRLPPTGKVLKVGTGAPVNGVMMESRLKPGDHVILQPGAVDRFIALPKLGDNIVLGFEPDVIAVVD